jgi:hypothetical protein
VSAWSLAVLLVVGTATASSPFGVNAHIPTTLLVDRVSEAGIEWARIDFVWAFVEPEQDVFDWELYDRVIGDLGARGIRIFATVAGTPAWATSGAEFSGPPDDPADWRDLCARAADRYRGRVAAWGMWNEPNLARFWTGSRDLYIDGILRPGAEAIRAADPGALVVGPDLAHLSSGDWDDWLRDVTIRGRDVLDVVVHHVYPSNDLASDVTDKLVSGDSFPFDRPSVREVLLRSGWWGRPFWLGETGVTSNPPNSENLQDRFYSDLLQAWFAPGGRDWVDRVFFYELADDPAIENAWGILGPPPDFVPKRAYATYGDFISEAGYDDAAIESVEGPLFVGSQGEVEIVLSVRNTGTTTWSSDRGDLVHVSVNQLLWTIVGGSLPDGREIRPGASVDIPVTVRVSSAFIDDPIPGLVVARMMDGNQSRFGNAATVPVILSDAPEPVGQATPVTHIARPGASVRFAIEAAGDPETTTLQWRRNTIPLADDDRVSGAREPILTVAGVDASLAGVYDCLVTTSAGSIAVRAGRLRVVADEVTAADPRRPGERLTSVSARWRAWRFSTLRGQDVNRR